MSYMTDLEIAALNESNQHRDTPFIIGNVSHTQLSIARRYGGCNYQGRAYTYLPETDELIRGDVLRWLAERRKTLA